MGPCRRCRLCARAAAPTAQAMGTSSSWSARSVRCPGKWGTRSRRLMARKLPPPPTLMQPQLTPRARFAALAAPASTAALKAAATERAAQTALDPRAVRCPLARRCMWAVVTACHLARHPRHLSRCLGSAAVAAPFHWRRASLNRSSSVSCRLPLPHQPLPRRPPLRLPHSARPWAWWRKWQPASHAHAAALRRGQLLRQRPARPARPARCSPSASALARCVAARRPWAACVCLSRQTHARRLMLTVLTLRARTPRSSATYALAQIDQLSADDRRSHSRGRPLVHRPARRRIDAG